MMHFNDPCYKITHFNNKTEYKYLPLINNHLSGFIFVSSTFSLNFETFMFSCWLPHTHQSDCWMWGKNNEKLLLFPYSLVRFLCFA